VSDVLVIRVMSRTSQKVSDPGSRSEIPSRILQFDAVHLLYLSAVFRLMLTYHSAADIISTVEFDHTGNYLATGDKGGRVVLFERNETVCIGCALFLQGL
jgi:hypothetical protein